MSGGEDRETEGLAVSPRSAVSLLGHDGAQDVLLRAWRSGRLPHAWLISGPRGIGKATLAFRFARFVLAGGEAEQGGLFGASKPDLGLFVDKEHSVARRIAAGAHPDLRVLEREAAPGSSRARTEITVDQARAAEAFLRLTPAEGGWRVVIIDPVEDLNLSAANAILKILEEPPERALLLLVSHAPARLLPTLRSRCCNLALGPLAFETVSLLLAELRPDLSQEERTALVHLADGSIGRAMDLAANGGGELYRELLAILETLPVLDVAAVHALGERMARGNDWAAFRTLSELLIWWLARLVRVRAGGAPPSAVVPAEEDLMPRLVGCHGLAPWVDVWEKTTRLLTSAEPAKLDRKQVLITALLGLEMAAS